MGSIKSPGPSPPYLGPLPKDVRLYRLGRKGVPLCISCAVMRRRSGKALELKGVDETVDEWCTDCGAPEEKVPTMKLIYCPSCDDIQKLTRDRRTCACERSWGHYRKDKRSAVMGGEAVPLGIENSSLSRALSKRPASGLGVLFTAFVIARKCSTIEQ